MKRKSFKKRILIMMAMAVIFVMAGSHAVFAAGEYYMPEANGDTHLTISVVYHDVDKDKNPIDTPIEGMELTAYKVASLWMNDEGGVKYRIVSDFHPTGVAFDWAYDDASASIAAAEKLVGHIESTDPKPAAVASITTDANGVADFGQVEDGIYLIVHTNSTGAALDYTMLDPWLVTAPEARLTLDENNDALIREDNEWIYNVVVNPKAEVLKLETPPPPDGPPTDDTPPPPNDPPPTEDDTPERRVINTGDATRIAIWAVLMAAAIVAIIVIKRKNKKQ